MPEICSIIHALIFPEIKVEKKKVEIHRNRNPDRQLTHEIFCRDVKHVKIRWENQYLGKNRFHSSLKCLWLLWGFLKQMYILQFFLCAFDLENLCRKQLAIGRTRLTMHLICCNDMTTLRMSCLFCLVLGNWHTYLSDRKLCSEIKVWVSSLLYCISIFCCKVNRKWHEKVLHLSQDS